MSRVSDFFDLLHDSSGRIDWVNSINRIVHFEYDEIIGEYTVLGLDPQNDKNVLIMYNNKTYSIYKCSLKNSNLGRVIKDNYDYAYDIDQVIENKYSKIMVTNRSIVRNDKGRSKRMYRLKCLKCGNEFDVDQCNLQSGIGCGVCSGHKTVKGINDMWTTNPEIANYLVDQEDGFKHSIKYAKYLKFYCPSCHKIIHAIPAFVAKTGFCCDRCSQNKSFPNRLMGNLLYELGVEYNPERTFKWCVFPSYSNKEEMSYGIFDFCIELMKLIIEMDGGCGHGNGTRGDAKYSLEECVYRDQQKEKLAIFNGYKVIRIDCNYKSKDNPLDYCKKNILESELATLFDLSSVNWNNILFQSLDKDIIKVCDLYNEGMRIMDIAEKMNIADGTVIRRLHIGNQIGLCSYIPQSQQSKRHRAEACRESNSVPIYCVEKDIAFQSSAIAEQISMKVIGISFTHSNFNRALRINSEPKYNGLHWKRMTKDEFADFRAMFPNKAYCYDNLEVVA